MRLNIALKEYWTKTETWFELEVGKGKMTKKQAEELKQLIIERMKK